MMQLTETLNMQAMEWALSKSALSQCQWVTKHITSHFAHGKNMQW